MRGGWGDTHVWPEFEVRDTALDVLLLGVVEVTVDDLLGEGKRAVKPTENFGQYASNNSK